MKQVEDAEIAKGGTIVRLGSTTPFHFDPRSWKRGVISILGDEVRIIGIEKWSTSRGALGRLIEGIEGAGLRPVVVGAKLSLLGVLKHWGWRATLVPAEGGGFVEEWRPLGRLRFHVKHG